MKLSVAMAAYNGASYLRQQLASILPQLAPGDELIVVDDASEDATCSMVAEFQDARIRLLKNPRNLGVLASFERALRNTTGEVIFLSDQDDLWRPDKVHKFLAAFADPEVTLVLSDAAVIDAEGNLVCRSFFDPYPFRPGVLRNVIRNRYLGCTMAFRRALLARVLPFPPKVPMHDMWIGMLNDIYGKTCYLDEPLVSYRRHGNNASRPGAWKQKLIWRARLLCYLCPVIARAIVSGKRR